MLQDNNTESSHFPHHKMFASISLRHGWVLWGWPLLFLLSLLAVWKQKVMTGVKIMVHSYFEWRHVVSSGMATWLIGSGTASLWDGFKDPHLLALMLFYSSPPPPQFCIRAFPVWLVEYNRNDHKWLLRLDRNDIITFALVSWIFPILWVASLFYG